MTRTTYATVWDALADTPEEAANMKIRADLVIAIVDKVSGWGVSQKEAARRLGITQPRLSELLAGKITKFSLDALVTLADRSNLQVRMVASPLRSDTLKKSGGGSFKKGAGRIGGTMLRDAVLTERVVKRSVKSRTKKTG